jgi:hypothetical protein
MLTIILSILAGYFLLRFCWHLTRPVAVIEPPAPVNVAVLTPSLTIHLHFHEAERGR